MRKYRRSLRALLVLTLAAMAVSVTDAPAEDSVTFLAVGDFSANTAAAAVLTAMGAETSDLTLALGDLSYGVTGQEQAWCDFVTGKLPPGYAFELLAGNHESNGQNGNINDFSACLPNQLPGLVGTYGRQYFVDVPRSNPLFRYVMISPSLGFPDGTYSYPAGSARYNWTAAAIDSARTAGIPWVVVGMHKPCLSVGVYGCDPGADIFNLLIDRKVDLVFSGHEHMYQRTKQLALGAGCAAVQPGTYNAACVADADSTLAKGAGLVSATVGTGGVGLRPVNLTDAEMPYFATVSGSNQNPSHGYLKLTASATRLDATFVRTDGALTDTFSIVDGPPPPNQPPVAALTAACTDLTCTFDGRGSTDPDGTIATYAWTFGDGTTGTGPTPSHTYTTAGDHPVTLTVTDDDGAASTPATTTVTVSPPPPNQPPDAALTAACTDLTCTFDGRGSTDPDGTIATYAWTFGDGTTGTGPTPGHTYTTAGDHPVTLTVTDDKGAASTPATTTVTVSPPPPNQPPTAALTAACTDLTCTFDGRGSTDPDGTIATYAWTFGDGTTGTGPTPSHTYTTAGDHPVTLTVTDDKGTASDPAAQTVSVTAPAGPTFLARDDFERTTASGFGTAPVGGAWSALAGSSVAGGTGRISLSGGNDKTILLPGGSGPAVDLRATLSADKAITGGGLQLNPIGRRVVNGTTTVGDYRGLVKLSSNGSVNVGLAFRPGSGAEVTLAAATVVPGLTLAPTEQLAVRLLVTGASPTTVQIKVWKAGAAEPTAWTRTATGNQAGMQVPGFTGLRTYLSGSVTNAPLTVRVDDWLAAVPQ